MGIIRGFAVVVLSVLLFLSLISSIFLLILSSSLNYENVQKESANTIRELLNDVDINAIINEDYPKMNTYCQNNTSSEYVFNTEGYTFSIPCDIVFQGKDAIIEEGVKDMTYDIYYSEYDCGFWDCFEKTEIPTFLISEKAHDYWRSKLFLSIIAFVVLGVLMFLFVEKKTSTPLTIGIFGAIAALIFFKIDVLFSLFPEVLTKFLKIFFSQSYSVSLKILIFGIVMIILGIALKIFKIGFKVSRISEWFKKGLKKEEAQKLEKTKKK